jgi:BirA family biotin operon repressor/biotin-[acetyl-CoA-carboxylase] ligase
VKAFWCDVLNFDSLGSTNEYLKELAHAGAREGTVVIAREQTAGKGRLGRSWASPQGGAWFSILLRPSIALGQAGCISILLAVSLAQALRKRWGLPIGVKWPNDLYVQNRKLGGILIELSSQAEAIEWLVAGIGVNVNNELPRDTRSPATSLARELGRKISLEEFFDTALEAIARDYQRFLTEGFAFVRQQWQELSVLGEHVIVRRGEVTSPLRGERFQVLGLSESGKLIVRTEQGVRELSSEEVTLCQPLLS